MSEKLSLTSFVDKATLVVSFFPQKAGFRCKGLITDLANFGPDSARVRAVGRSLENGAVPIAIMQRSCGYTLTPQYGLKNQAVKMAFRQNDFKARNVRKVLTYYTGVCQLMADGSRRSAMAKSRGGFRRLRTQKMRSTKSERFWHVAGRISVLAGIVAATMTVIPKPTNSGEPRQYVEGINWTIPPLHPERGRLDKATAACR